MSKPDIKRYFFDTEFVEEDKNLFDITFISIGIVSESGKEELYEISSEFNESSIGKEWVIKNVISKLDSNIERRTNKDIRDKVLNMLVKHPADTVQFWSKNGAYDNMILCRLFGGMIEFRQACKDIGIKNVVFKDINEFKMLPNYKDYDIPQKDEDTAHIAIDDAKVERQVYLTIMHG